MAWSTVIREAGPVAQLLDLRGLRGHSQPLPIALQKNIGPHVMAAGFLAVAFGAGLAQSLTIPSGERRRTTDQEASVSVETNGQAEDAEAARKAERAT